MKATWVFALFLALAGAETVSAQQKIFEWQAANDESVRLDPANYHTGRTYHPGPQGGNLHVDIASQEPRVAISRVPCQSSFYLLA
jgi:hypothetical protein